MDAYDKALDKRDKNKPMSMKDMQILNICLPSSLYNDYFPKYLKEMNIPLDSKFKYPVWKAIWDAMVPAYNKHMEDMVTALGTPSINWRGMTYLL